MCIRDSILTGSVLHILYDLQRILYGRAALLSVNIDTGSDTAVIMLKFFPIDVYKRQHTTRDCPLCISPVTNTFSTLVWYWPGAVFTRCV